MIIRSARFNNLRIAITLSLCLFGLISCVETQSQVEQLDAVRIVHCLAGCPLGASQNNDIVARPIYTLSFNHDTRVADWAAYVVTENSIGVATNLDRAPQIDPFVADTLNLEDYGNAAEELSLEAQYLVPLVSFAGTPYWRDVNYLTNRVPRNMELTRGAWYGLEWAIRNLANRGEPLYVVTGPLYDSQSDQLLLPTEKPHSVPNAFFKVIATADGSVTAFVFRQDLPFHIHHCEQRVPLVEVEQLSGLSLFPEQSGWPVGDLSERLGCF